MNDRIKKLYTEASEWALHKYPPPVNPFEWEDLRSKKFAELIVRECIKELENDARCRIAGADRIVAKHFGVEE